MRVLVTGATGFIGGHTCTALRAAGHEVVAFARDVDAARRVLGAAVVEVVAGDVTDERSVAAALRDADAVVHAAAAVTTSRKRHAEVEATNVRGAEVVLTAAAALGLDPIVHVSSIAALFDPARPRLGTEDPVATPSGAYGRSKARAERVARDLQGDGSPVVITYPAMVLGPFFGRRGGEGSGGVAATARAGVVPITPGGWSIVDVRDVAMIHAAVMHPGHGPRRYLATGTYCTMPALADLFEAATGRHFRRLPMSERAMFAWGSMSDLAQRVFGYDSSISREGFTYLTRAQQGDDAAVLAELGIAFRPPRESLRASLAGLVACGELSPRHAGDAGDG